MCKKIMRCVVVFALVLALVCSSTVAYAAEARRIVEKTEQKDHNDIQIERIEDNKLRIVENGETSIIEVNQVSPAVTEIRLIGPDNETLVLTTDRERQTITSSQTGKTISISEFFEPEPDVETQYTPKTRTLKYSYAAILRLISGIVTIATIAAAVCALITLPHESILATVISLLNNIPNIVNLVKGGSSANGIKVTMRSYQKTVHHGHDSAVVELWKVTKISKY